MTELDELLKIAGVPNNAHTRSELRNNLEIAGAECDWRRHEKQVSADFLHQLDKNITTTLVLLQKLAKNPTWRDICFEMYVSGDGTAVAVSPKEVFQGKLTLPRKPPPRRHPLKPTQPTDTIIAVNVHAALSDIHAAILTRASKVKQNEDSRKKPKNLSVCFTQKTFLTDFQLIKQATTQKTHSPSSANFFTAPSAALRRNLERSLGTFVKC